MQELATSPQNFTTPKPGASLLLAFRSPQRQQNVLIIGSGLLSASRAFASLEAGYSVVVLAKDGLRGACAEIRWRVEKNECKIVDWDSLPSHTPTSEEDFTKLDNFLSTNSFSLACVTDTVTCPSRRSRTSAENLYRILKSHHIPVNTTDMPELCDFTFASSHRFDDLHTSNRTPLQIGVTTNGQGCRLASRIRRDIVSKLSRDVGVATAKLGKLRQMAKDSAEPLESEDVDLVNEDNGVSTPNHPVPQRSTSETVVENARRRMKWVAQVSEYWPISKLAEMSEKEMDEVLLGENLPAVNSSLRSSVTSDSRHSLDLTKRGRILLVGSGPGHPSLLTIATHTALSQLADLVLADKLVPDAVLNLIPKNIPIQIARKFPGNADGAQQEMMEAAIDAANIGLTVVRLKQGDPIVYGRAGEEVLYFRKHGYEPLVIPGVSSALAGPTFAGIPITQRGVAESFIVCTGVGRKGKDVQLPGYERSRTLIVLMGVARLAQVVETLTFTSTIEEEEGKASRRDGLAYPRNTPIAIIERASMSDQRVLMSTLENVVEALDSCGEQRPPGMIVIGWSVLALWGSGDVKVLDEVGMKTDDVERVRKWLDGNRWRVIEGLGCGWEDFELTSGNA
ncbi:hypothetical protein AGABI2DRAFT_196395 [Agaricus bisporus var. bisporus H97]|uniref:hypothetical protein n=1 Tax=Agaricus bisporus var. bisporus (strain H97 / ATCC MYA-4626 / FGSC 10389) TaxID=936046 RepID=UPI00029F70F4|nr:hypothetical protein AGABI2DRAFT_196395 [Agaricus bisporus var. bisporus H97]EKV50860.1 hypothetical protein AGABI2DRAFT_196395 [Agaricus bisporus var. bisporus H97]